MLYEVITLVLVVAESFLGAVDDRIELVFYVDFLPAGLVGLGVRLGILDHFFDIGV